MTNVINILSRRWLLTLLFAIGAGPLMAETVFTHRAPESDTDRRQNYEIALLRLALEKTAEEYGPFRLEPAPRINVARSIHSLRQNAYPNHFFGLGYEEVFNTYPEMAYVRFPLDLGVLGHRTCFVPETMKKKVAEITTLDELRKLTIGQGRGWVDNVILRHNGFNVVEVEEYEALFRMTAAHRFDLFCRGANEVKAEYERWGHIEGLAYDWNILLYYPVPRFFYTHKENVEAIERVTKGLHEAYEDGSLKKLWEKAHAASVEFAHLEKRRMFRLENPLIESIDFDHDSYSFQLGPRGPATKAAR